MPFHIQASGGKYKVVGDYKGQHGHVYGSHDSEESARGQQKALYANVPEARKSASKRRGVNITKLTKISKKPKIVMRNMSTVLRNPSKFRVATGVVGQAKKSECWASEYLKTAEATKTAIIPSWGGGQYTIGAKGPVGLQAGYSYALGAVPLPDVGVRFGGENGGVGVGGILPYISVDTGARPGWQWNSPQSIWGWLHDKLSGEPKIAGATDGFGDLIVGTPEGINRRAIRVATMAEYEAANLYERLSEVVPDKKLKKVLLDIGKEEKVHVGELEQMLRTLDPQHGSATREGAKEVKESCWASEYLKTADDFSARAAEIKRQRRHELLAGLVGGGLGAAAMGVTGGMIAHGLYPASSVAPAVGEIAGGVMGSNIGRHVALSEIDDSRKPGAPKPSFSEIISGVTPSANDPAPGPVNIDPERPQILPMSRVAPNPTFTADPAMAAL